MNVDINWTVYDGWNGHVQKPAKLIDLQSHCARTHLSVSSFHILIDFLRSLDPYKEPIVAVFAGKICFAFDTNVHFSISNHGIPLSKRP